MPLRFGRQDQSHVQWKSDLCAMPMNYGVFQSGLWEWALFPAHCQCWVRLPQNLLGDSFLSLRQFNHLQALIISLLNTQGGPSACLQSSSCAVLSFSVLFHENPGSLSHLKLSALTPQFILYAGPCLSFPPLCCSLETLQVK